MDSGCSYHMTPVKEYFSDLKFEQLGTVKLGDDRACQVVGSGTVTLKLSNGMVVDLKNVRYIPKLKKSLMSLGLFEKTGYKVVLWDGKAKVSKGSMVVLSGNRRENNTYLLDGEVVAPGSVNMAMGSNQAALLWHRRLGHISSQGIVELNKQQLLGKLSNCVFDFCEGCVLGKHKRV